jgi:hypothetical protein
VHDADAALLGDGDGQACLCHGVHGGGHQRQVQLDVAGEFRREGRVLGQDLGVRWHQQHIVEGERFSKKAHEKAPKNGLYPPSTASLRPIAHGNFGVTALASPPPPSGWSALQ